MGSPGGPGSSTEARQGSTPNGNTPPALNFESRCRSERQPWWAIADGLVAVLALVTVLHHGHQLELADRISLLALASACAIWRLLITRLMATSASSRRTRRLLAADEAFSCLVRLAVALPATHRALMLWTDQLASSYVPVGGGDGWGPAARNCGLLLAALALGSEAFTLKLGGIFKPVMLRWCIPIQFVAVAAAMTRAPRLCASAACTHAAARGPLHAIYATLEAALATIAPQGRFGNGGGATGAAAAAAAGPRSARECAAVVRFLQLAMGLGLPCALGAAFESRTWRRLYSPARRHRQRSESADSLVGSPAPPDRQSAGQPAAQSDGRAAAAAAAASPVQSSPEDASLGARQGRVRRSLPARLYRWLDDLFHAEDPGLLRLVLPVITLCLLWDAAVLLAAYD